MIHIKKFIDKLAVMDAKGSRDVVLPASDARGLRDELTKLLADLHTYNKTISTSPVSIESIEISGGKFK